MGNSPSTELFPGAGEFLLRPGEEGDVAEKERDLLERAARGEEEAFRALADA